MSAVAVSPTTRTHTSTLSGIGGDFGTLATSPFSGSACLMSPRQPYVIAALPLVLAVHINVGALGADTQPFARTASSRARVVAASESEEQSAAQSPRALQETIEEIRRHLSLNITELAAVLGVERATVYAWMKGATASPRERAKRERVAFVARVANAWNALAGVPADSWVHFPALNGRSLFDLLKADGGSEDDREVNALLHKLVDRVGRAADRLRDDTPAGRYGDALSHDALRENLATNLEWLRTVQGA